MERHIVRLVQANGSDGWPVHEAQCSCSWNGPECHIPSDASADAERHILFHRRAVWCTCGRGWAGCTCGLTFAEKIRTVNIDTESLK